MVSLNKNRINYTKFIAQLCDFKALELSSYLKQTFLGLFILNFRFLSLSNKNGLYFLRNDLFNLPESSKFLKKSGLARAQINQLNVKYTSPIVSVDYRTLQFLKGADVPHSLKTKAYAEIGDLLAQKRGLNILWNDGTILKHLLVWEQVYAPGLLMLQGFSNWHVFFMREREWFFFSSWAKREVNYLLMLILISRGFSQVFSQYMPHYVLKELTLFLEKSGPLQDRKNHLIPFYMWVFDMLRWSSLLAGGKEAPFKVVLEEKNKLIIKDLVYDEEIISFGGWMQAHKEDLIGEVRHWVHPQISEFKNEELFEELIEMEDVYDGDIIDNDAFISQSDVFVWPWTRFWDLYYALDFIKSKKFFLEVTDVHEHDLLMSFYFSINSLEKRLEPIPTNEYLMNYFEQTFRTSAWDDVLKWFKFFYPKTFNTVQLIGFNRYPLLMFLAYVISKVNGFFLYGFHGFDRRNIFFRFFIFFVLKHRGFCFKWFSILLKKVSYKLPWDEELTYILHVLEQDQIFFQEVCKKKLYNYFYMEDELLKLRNEGKNPFLYFFHFFFRNHWGNLVRKKRQELYPDFIQKLEYLLFKDPDQLSKFAFRVTVHIYITIFWDFIKDPMSFVKYIRLFEAEFDKKTPRVFDVNLKDYGKDHKGGSYFKFFRYREKFEVLLKETLHENKFVRSTTEGNLNEFLFRKNLKWEDVRWGGIAWNNKQWPLSIYDKKSKWTWAVVVFFFFKSYKQFFIYFFKTLKHPFISFSSFLVSGFISSSAYKFSEYYLKYFNIYSEDMPTYKKKLKKLYHIGLKKEWKDDSNQQTRHLFYRRWWNHLFSFRRIFKFHLILVFLIEVCWYYLMRIIYRVVLNLYKSFWYRVFVYRRWIWRIKNTARLRFYDWSPDLDYSILRGISKERKIREARKKAKAADSHYQPKIVVYLAKKIEESETPFRNDLWREMYKWLISLFFYRKLRKRGFVLKRELTYMFGKKNTDLVINMLLNFKFWSFFFTYLYLFLLRSILLSILFFIFFSLSFFFDFFFGVVKTQKYLYTKFKQYFKLFFLQTYVVAFSFFYGLSLIIFYSFFFLFFCGVLLFKSLKWWSLIIFYFLQYFKILYVFSPLISLAIWIRMFCKDVWLTIRFNWYWFLVFFFNWWAFVRFIVILTLGFFLFLLVTVWYAMKGAFFNNKVRKDYSTMLYFFFKEETSIFYHDFKDFLFFLSLFIKSFCLVLSFFMFLFGQVGWRLVKFIFGKGYESDALYIKPEIPKKKVFRFLDVYVKMFVFKLKESCLDKPALFFYVLYFLTLELFVLVLKVISILIFLVVFFFNFVVVLCESTDKGLYFIKFIQQLSGTLSLIFGFIRWCLTQFWLWLWQRIASFSFDGKNIKSLINFSDRAMLTLSLRKILILKILLVLLQHKSLNLFLKLAKISFKNSHLWSDFLKKITSKMDEPGFNLKRDLQEVVVFISIVYEFSSFYWAYIQKLSIEVGELGWWLSYYDRKKEKKRQNFSKNVGFYQHIKEPLKYFSQRWRLGSRSRTAKNNTNFYSRKHSYYLHINKSFSAIQRYRPYIINKMYVEKAQSVFRKTSFVSRFFNFKPFFKRVASFLGLSFLFEILFLRFQQPISSFLFGDKNKIFPAHVLVRLKFFKDFFSEFNWLVSFTYDSKAFGMDNLLARFLPSFFTNLAMKQDYFTKHRSNWLYKVFITLKPRVVDLLPRFRWNYVNLFSRFFKFFLMSFAYVVGLLCLVIVMSFIVHFVLYLFIFYFLKLVVFWIWSFFRRFWFLLFISSLFFLCFVLYTLGFLF